MTDRPIRFYGTLLRLLPRDLREEYGAEMLALFRSRLADASGRRARWTLLARASTDLLIQAAGARWSDLHTPAAASRVAELGSDVRLSLRRLGRDSTTSFAAVVSLALAIGACTSAFRLVDGLLFRPLAVEQPDELYRLSFSTPSSGLPPEGWDSGPYVMYEAMKEAVAPEGRVFMASRTYQSSVTVGNAPHPEPTYLQRLSGEAFATLGVRPAAGRLFGPEDDVTPGEHPVAVLSHEYWMRRFGGRPGAIGTSLRIGNTAFDIIGVIDGPFAGMETGRTADVFVPTIMGGNVLNLFQNGLTGYLRIVDADQSSAVLTQLESSWLSFQEVRTAQIESWSAAERESFLNDTRLHLSSASAGASELQREFQRPLMILSVLVALVLLVAATNVANLMIVRAGRRRTDAAIRVSIGAGRGRLIQLVLVESAIIGLAATALGLALSAWAVPKVLQTLGETGDPVRLLLPFDARLALFSLALALATTTIFGLVPAWRASRVEPIHALKGGAAGSISRRTPHALIAVQAGFCFVILFAAGLFTHTSRALSDLHTGFSSQGVLALTVLARPSAAPARWDELTDELRTVPGVQQVALAGWALLEGSSTNGVIAWGGQEPKREVLTEFLCITPGWLDVMGVALLRGRDVQSEDEYPNVVLVNESFLRTYTNGQTALGSTFERVNPLGDRVASRIVGVVGDVRYLNLRDAPPPTAYIPCRSTAEDGAPTRRGFAALMVRTNSDDPDGMTSALRERIAEAGAGFTVVRAKSQELINRRHTVRERLLASLGSFFGLVALLLAGVGLYGVMHDSVQQRQRELSVRIALGSPVDGIARAVASKSFAWLAAGIAGGVLVAIPLYRLVQGLLFGAGTLSPFALLLPAAIIAVTGFVAATPGTLRALRTDPAQALRAE